MSFRMPIGSILVRSEEGHADRNRTSANEIVHLALVFALFIAALGLLVLAVL